MPDIKNIKDHKAFARTDGKTDAMYMAILELISTHVEDGAISPTEAVGVLDWVKSVIIFTNTDFDI